MTSIFFRWVGSTTNQGRDLESFHLMKLVDLDADFFFFGGGRGRILDTDLVSPLTIGWSNHFDSTLLPMQEGRLS